MDELHARKSKKVLEEHTKILNEHHKASEKLEAARLAKKGVEEATAVLAEKRKLFVTQVHCIFQRGQGFIGDPGDSNRLMIYM